MPSWPPTSLMPCYGQRLATAGRPAVLNCLAPPSEMPPSWPPTAARVAKARALLDTIGDLEDPQVGLRLLRSCAGHSRMIHNLRCTPPQPQLPSLQEFDSKVRRSFTSLTGLHLDQLQWDQAARGLALAGLGLRSVVRDAPACCLASIGASDGACAQLDPAFHSSPPHTHSEAVEALRMLNGQVTDQLARAQTETGVCCAGGERTTRHNALRDAICVWADRAGLQPEKGKPGLLIPQRPEDTSSARRRPADMFVPSYLGSPTAFDLAVTAPSRQETLGEAARASLVAATAYAAVKRTHLDTAAACRSHGFDFQPLVVETTGAWEPASAAFLRRLARAAAAHEGGQVDLHAGLLQELSVITRTFRARAILRRQTELALTGSVSGRIADYFVFLQVSARAASSVTGVSIGGDRGGDAGQVSHSFVERGIGLLIELACSCSSVLSNACCESRACYIGVHDSLEKVSVQERVISLVDEAMMKMRAPASKVSVQERVISLVDEAMMKMRAPASDQKNQREASPFLHVHVSLPCTGGSPLQNFSGGKFVKEHEKIFFSLVDAVEKILSRLLKQKFTASFELPNSNRYWSHPKVVRAVQAWFPSRAVVHACAMGIEGVPGLPIKKAFRLNFSDFALSEKYPRKFARYFVRTLCVLALEGD
eukprot:s1599_g13.t1